MRTPLIYLIITCFTISLMVFTGCKKCDCPDPENPECSNYDPCHDKTNIDANFEAYRLLSNTPGEYFFDIKTSADTSYLITSINFSVYDKSYKSYEWIIGTDPKHRFGSTMNLSFLLQNKETIPVTLIVKGSEENNCVQNGELYDTVTRYIVFKHIREFSIFGRYEGYLDEDKSKLMTVRIESQKDTKEPLGYRYYITGLPVAVNSPPNRFGDTAVYLQDISNDLVLFDNSESKNRPAGKAKLNQKDNTLDIEYRILDPYPTINGLKFKVHHFKGIKTH